MRILAFCDYFDPDSCGGAERVARELYDRLCRRPGWEITLLSAVPRALAGGDEVREHTMASGLRVVTVPATDLAGKIGVQLTVSKRLRAEAARLLEELRPDVLHAHSLHFHGTIVAAALARRTGCPLVTTAHLGSSDDLSGMTKMMARLWDVTIANRIVHSSTRVVAVSNAVADHLRAIGANERQLVVAPNGVDHDSYSPPQLPRPRGPLEVGFIGRMIANKGPEVLIAAAESAVAHGADLRLTFVGDGPLRGLVERRVSDGVLANRTTFTGQVRDVADRLRLLDVIARPSTTEGLPLAVLEAMATGCPVLASDVAGNREVVHDGDNGMVFKVGDFEALSAALCKLAADRPEVARLGAEAVLTASSYTWGRSADMHAQALISAAARSDFTVV